MFGLGAGELFIIVAFALIFIGPKKLPELARNLGKGLREFQKAKDEFMHHVENEKAEIDKDLAKVNGEHEEHDPKLTGVHEPDLEGSLKVGHDVSEEDINQEVAAMEEALNKSHSSEESSESSDELPKKEDSQNS